MREWETKPGSTRIKVEVEGSTLTDSLVNNTKALQALKCGATLVKLGGYGSRPISTSPSHMGGIVAFEHMVVKRGGTY